MANTTISPNMNLIIPTVGVDPGPDWANNLNASLTSIDQHTHAVGSGVQITPLGLNINADLPMNANNLTLIRTTRFSPQSIVLSGAADVGCLYEVGVDLYYNDGAGNQVRITQSGSVTGSAGTITGLPSGTASASYAAGTFTFQSATNTPAAMSFGPISIGQQVISPNKITIQSPFGLAANYTLTLPAAQGAVSTALINDGAGNLSFQPYLSEVQGNHATGVAVNGSFVNVSSVSLTAGTWLISGAVNITNGGLSTNYNVVIGTTSASSAGTVSGINNFSSRAIDSGAPLTISIVPFPVTIGGSTTYYLNINSTNAGTTDGVVSATRIRT